MRDLNCPENIYVNREDRQLNRKMVVQEEHGLAWSWY